MDFSVIGVPVPESKGVIYCAKRGLLFSSGLSVCPMNTGSEINCEGC